MSYLIYLFSTWRLPPVKVPMDTLMTALPPVGQIFMHISVLPYFNGSWPGKWNRQTHTLHIFVQADQVVWYKKVVMETSKFSGQSRHTEGCEVLPIG